MANNAYNRQSRSGRQSSISNGNSLQQYKRRRPVQKRKNNDGILWFLIIVIGIVVICSVVFLLNFLKDDGGMPEDTDNSAVIGQTQEQTSGEDTKNEQTTAGPVETDPPKEPEYKPEFKADLSEYEMYMNPQGADRDAYLILVNPWNALGENDVPPDLVGVKSTRKDGQRATQQLREYAAKALEALMLEAEACGVIKKNTPSGYPLSVMSAYRTYAYQNQLFNRYVNEEMSYKGLTREEAEKIVVTYSCRAGTSEHQTGLCVDMHTLAAAHQSFQYESEAKWLAENSYKFGFVLRFPADKTEVTGITYEPWHFRYVGRYHAKKMYDLDMCLEEYTEYLKTND